MALEQSERNEARRLLPEVIKQHCCFVDQAVYIIEMFKVSNSPSAVGRPREFDLEEASRKAMNVFWDRGFHDASLPDLLAAMELSRGSFYKAFGDKEAVFLRALDLYIDDAVQNVREGLKGDTSPAIAIRNTLRRHADMSSGAQGARGCFAVLTAAEMLPASTEAAQRIATLFRRLQDLFADAIARGQNVGEFGEQLDAQATARFLVAHAQGMRVIGKAGSSRQEMLANVDLAMKLLS